MAKKIKKSNYEPDSVFFMKIVLYFLLGSMWIDVANVEIGDSSLVVPIGLILGIYFAHHEHFQIDRKIEYTLLLFTAVLSFIAPIGFVFVI